MRRIWGFTGTWLLAYASLSAATIELDRRAGLDLSSYNQIRFLDWPQIQVSPTLSLPAKEMTLELAAGQTISQITFQQQAREPIGQLPADIRPFDSPTSLDGRYDRLSSALGSDRLGAHTIHLLGELTIGGKRYARLLVFPVTVDSTGELFFCDSLTILSDRQEIGPDRVKTALSGADSPESALAEIGAERRSPTSYSDYVIITSAQLADSFRPLAAHRTQTGYRTSIALVEDIITRYNGRDSAEQIREYLKEFYANGGRYVLLGGDETVVPIRYAYSADAGQAVHASLLQVADLYFADLTGDWNRDEDSIWGERTEDAPDLTPELFVGRLPVNTADEVGNYVNKLIRYETNPGNGDPSYLSRVFFFSSDQMRDYSPVTQHSYIAKAYPASMAIDTIYGIEAVRGDDPAPSNLAPRDLGPVLSQGYGIINILAHGRGDGFAVKSSGYNTGARAMLWTNPSSGENNTFELLQAPNRPAFYYSLACENGAFDESSPPFNYGARNMAQELLSERDGAVGMVANSRWGWIGTSYILQRTFFDSLFAHPDRPAVHALYACKAKYSYYRDLILGQNYFGDPTMIVYTSTPSRQAVQAVRSGDTLTITVLADGHASVGARVLVSDSNGVAEEQLTDQSGVVKVIVAVDLDHPLCISAVKPGCTTAQTWYYPSVVTDVREADQSRPGGFALSQNYPNPFNPSTQITFSLPVSGHTELTIFDLLGRQVTTLVNGPIHAGVHQVEWSGTNGAGKSVAAGVYFYRLSSGTQTETRKMLLLK